MIHLIFESKYGNTLQVTFNLQMKLIWCGEQVATWKIGIPMDWEIHDEDRVIILTPTYENLAEQRRNPEAPLRYTSDKVRELVEKHTIAGNLVGVVVCGNRNFGADFCAAKRDFHPSVKILREIDLRGDAEDIEQIIEQIPPF